MLFKEVEVKKDLRISELNDLYGELLTERQREIIQSYYDFDLSLAEISENYGITRQAVRDAIVKGEQQLEVYEKTLRLLARKYETLQFITSLKYSVEKGDLSAIAKILSDFERDIQE